MKNDITQIKEIINQTEYNNLIEKVENEYGKVILLGLGGSHAYGLQGENSDLDLRGVIASPVNNLLGFGEFEQYIDEETDTVLYEFNKIIKLLCSCNPNTIEILGLKKEQQIVRHEVGEELLRNKTMFLSQRATGAFKGYSLAQLHRLENALCRDVYTEEQALKHKKNALERALLSFKNRYEHFEKGSIKVHADGVLSVDCNINKFPVREFGGMISELREIEKNYDKVNTRNCKKDNEHLSKHICHIFRLLFMYIDIATKKEIVTYREKEHDFLMQSKQGLFVNEDGTLRKEFYDKLNEVEKDVEYATKHIILPKEPDMKEIEEFVIECNKKFIKEELK